MSREPDDAHKIDYVDLKAKVLAALDTYQTTVDMGEEKKYIAWRLRDALDSFDKLNEVEGQQKQLITLLDTVINKDGHAIRHRLSNSILKAVVENFSSSLQSTTPDEKKTEAKNKLASLKAQHKISSEDTEKQKAEFKKTTDRYLPDNTKLLPLDETNFARVKSKLLLAADHFIKRYKTPESSKVATLPLTRARNFKYAISKLEFNQGGWPALLEVLYLQIWQLSSRETENTGEDTSFKQDILAALNVSEEQINNLPKQSSWSASRTPLELNMHCQYFPRLKKTHADHIFDTPFPENETAIPESKGIELQQIVVGPESNQQKIHRILKNAAEAVLAETGHSEIDIAYAQNLLDELKTSEGDYITELTLASAIIFESNATTLISKIKHAGIDREKLRELRRGAGVFVATPFVLKEKQLAKKTKVGDWNDLADRARSAALAYRTAGLGGADGKLRAENFIRALDKIKMLPYSTDKDKETKEKYLITQIWAVFKTSSDTLKNALLDFIATIAPRGLDEAGLEDLYKQFYPYNSTYVDDAKKALERKEGDTKEIDFSQLKENAIRAMNYSAKNADKEEDRTLALKISTALQSENSNAPRDTSDDLLSTRAEASSLTMQSVSEFSEPKSQETNSESNATQRRSTLTANDDRIVILMQLAGKSDYLKHEIEACTGVILSALKTKGTDTKNQREKIESELNIRNKSATTHATAELTLAITESAHTQDSQIQQMPSAFTHEDINKIKAAIDGYLREMASKTGFAKTWDSFRRKEGRRRALILYRILDKMTLPKDNEQLTTILGYIQKSNSTNLLNRILLHTGMSKPMLEERIGQPTAATSSITSDDVPLPPKTSDSKDTNDQFIDAVFTALDVYQIHNYGELGFSAEKNGKLRAARFRQELERAIPLTHTSDLGEPRSQDRTVRSEWQLLSDDQKINFRKLICAFVLESKSADLTENILQATGWEKVDFEKLKKTISSENLDTELKQIAQNLVKIIPNADNADIITKRIASDAIILKKTLTEVASRYLERPASLRAQSNETKIRNLLDALNEINHPFNLDKMIDLIRLTTLFADFANTGIEDDLRIALNVEFGVNDFQGHLKQFYPEPMKLHKDYPVTVPADSYYYPEKQPTLPENFETTLNERFDQLISHLKEKITNPLENTKTVYINNLLASLENKDIKTRITACCAFVFETGLPELNQSILSTLNLSRLELMQLKRHYKISNNAVRQKAFELVEFYKVDWAELKKNTLKILTTFIQTNLAEKPAEKALLYKIFYILSEMPDSISLNQKYILMSFLNSVMAQNQFPPLKTLLLENIKLELINTKTEAETVEATTSQKTPSEIFSDACKELATLYGGTADITKISLPESLMDVEMLKNMLSTAADYCIMSSKDRGSINRAGNYKTCLQKCLSTEQVLALTLWAYCHQPCFEFQTKILDCIPFDNINDRLSEWVSDPIKKEWMGIAKKMMPDTQPASEREVSRASLFANTSISSRSFNEEGVASREPESEGDTVNNDNTTQTSTPSVAYDDQWALDLHKGMLTAIEHYLKNEKADVEPKNMSEGRRRAENIKAALLKISVAAPVSDKTKQQLALLICTAVLHNPHAGRVGAPGSKTLRAKLLFYTGNNAMTLEKVQADFNFRYACESLSSRMIDSAYLEKTNSKERRETDDKEEIELKDTVSGQTTQEPSHLASFIPLLDPTRGNDRFWVDHKSGILLKITDLLQRGNKNTQTYKFLNNLKTLLGSITTNPDNISLENRQIAQVIFAFTRIDGMDKVKKIIFEETTDCSKEDLEFLRRLEFDIEFLTRQCAEFAKDEPNLLSTESNLSCQSHPQLRR